MGATLDYSTFVVFEIDGFKVTANLLIAMVTHVLVLVGWWKMFTKAGLPGWQALIPLYGDYKGYRLGTNDFSASAIFASANFVGAIAQVIKTDNLVINIMPWVANIMWLFHAWCIYNAYGTGMMVGLAYAFLPWLGSPFVGFGPYKYSGPWVYGPDAEKQKKAERLPKAERRERARELAKAGNVKGKPEGKKKHK